MRSKVHISSHPLHPILIPFPIAFFTGTLISHLAGWWLDHVGLLQTAYYLNGAGIFFAVLAAIPGLIDLVYTVPPNSSAKKRGVRHGILNSLMLILFIVAFFYRKDTTASHGFLLLVELAGVLCMMVAGWMGGTLVYRNQIGVDHRYANAGKWNEIYLGSRRGLVEIPEGTALKINAMMLVHIQNRRLVVARTENGFVAFDDHCPHKGGSLAGGSLACGTVHCPWHGSQFKVHTGEVTAGPAHQAIRTYSLVQQDGKIFLETASL